MATGLSGCRWASSTAAHEPSLLKPLDMVDDGVQLEIISIRFSPHDEELNGMLWDQIDEQQIPLATRRALGENGFRAGVISGELPAPLARKLAAAEKKPATMTEAAARLEKASPVSRQQMQLHSGWRGEIIASNIYPEVPLLMNEHGEVSGHTYQQAQGILAAKAEALGDRRVTLHLTPELQYGEPRQEWISEDGRILPQSGKPKRVFERLAFDATLEPSQMLVLTASPERPGTLGHYFFTEPQPDSDEVQQKLVVVRLGQTRYDNLFPPAAENESKSVDAPSDKNDPAQRPKQSSQRSASEP
ncbi:MAG TPA: hypothetical protein VFE46_13100 [Pirellulales bacterium]|nr:hypothetical protein [Pirellulales bacterium]